MKFSRPPRRLDRLFVDAPVFFITCCTYRKRPKFANEALHNAFIAFAERAASDFAVAIGRYLVMPDHLHFFVAGPNEFDLGNWIGILKRTLLKALPKTDSQDPVWQRGFFDHVLRSDKAMRKNGIMCGRIRCARNWSTPQIIGPTPAKSC